jgi:thiamine-phosphate pyrophosphorylase
MRRYYITDRRGCPNLLDCIAKAAADGVELIQIREKDLNARELLELVWSGVRAVNLRATRIVVNGRADIALAGNAHGVQLPSGSIPVREWRRVLPPDFLIGVSCHSLPEIQEASGADFLVYGPVFSSPGKGPAVGLDALRRAVEATTTPVFALGGITTENAAACLDAGAAGIAGIRLFQGRM